MDFLNQKAAGTDEFSLTPQGKLLSKNHPQTLRGIILL